MKNIINVIIKSSINADGFNVEILEDKTVVESNSYHYGYNASYKTYFANENKPYVGDIISELKKKYAGYELIVTAGENVYNGQNVNDEDVKRFKEKYLK